VYTTTSEKIDVKFDNKGRVSYKTFTKQAFDAQSTKEQCPKCKENDEVGALSDRVRKCAFMVELLMS
jgi:hypothetical protein